jgi:hypothetical protein
MQQTFSQKCPRCGVPIAITINDMKISRFLARKVTQDILIAHMADYHTPRPRRTGLLRLIRGR